MCFSKLDSLHIKWDDFATNVAVAVATGFISVALAAQIKSSRVKVDIDALTERLRRILDLKAGTQPDVQEIEALRDEAIKIAEEMAQTDGRWLRLNRYTRDRFDRWRKDLAQLQVKRSNERNIRVLGYTSDSSDFVRMLIAQLEEMRSTLWFGTYLFPWRSDS